MMPSAGAMAAPAITVSSDIERMVAVTRLETFFCSIKIIGSFSSTKLFLSLEIDSRFPQIGRKITKNSDIN